MNNPLDHSFIIFLIKLNLGFEVVRRSLRFHVASTFLPLAEKIGKSCTDLHLECVLGLIKLNKPDHLSNLPQNACWQCSYNHCTIHVIAFDLQTVTRPPKTSDPRTVCKTQPEVQPTGYCMRKQIYVNSGHIELTSGPVKINTDLKYNIALQCEVNFETSCLRVLCCYSSLIIPVYLISVCR